MKIKRVDIENFRAIKKSTILFHELTALVGENNSGKTAILRALNCVFNYEFEADDFQNGAHRYAPRTVTKIIVTFSEIPENDIYRDMIDSEGEIHLKLTYNYSRSTSGRRLFFEKNGESKPLETSFIDILKKDIDFVYIPASRGTKDIEWSERAIFSRLITKYLEEHTKNRDTLSQRAIIAGDKLVDQVLNRLASELNSLNMYNDIGKYKIDYREAIDYRIFLDRLGLEIMSMDGTYSLPVSEYGSGIKSLTVIALHRMYANLNNVSIVLGIEEPETNLHPQAQRMLIESLQNSRQSCETQAIFATHSTVIIDALSHNDIVLVRKVKDNKRGFHSESNQLSETFWEDHGIKELKHYNFFRYRNSDFFFARFVILTESITDAQVIGKMLRKKSAEKMFYVSIVNLNGVDNLRYPFFLLKDLHIPFITVVDKDFFTNYKNGNLKHSRDPKTCLPEYSGEISNNKVIDYLFDSEQKRDELKQYLGKSYSQFFDFTKNYGILSMQYCLEMDMIATDKICDKYYDYYKLKDDERKPESLLIERKDAIKDPEVLLSIFDSLEPKDYPISFKKIRKSLIEMIAEI